MEHGLSALYNIFYDINPKAAWIIYAVNDYLPRLVVSAAIVWLGIRLVKRKKTSIEGEIKQEDENEADI